MMYKGKNQQYVEIQPSPFHNDDPINDHLDITGKSLSALQPKYQLHYVVYPILEANESALFNLLICFKQSGWWGNNFMND